MYVRNSANACNLTIYLNLITQYYLNVQAVNYSLRKVEIPQENDDYQGINITSAITWVLCKNPFTVVTLRTWWKKTSAQGNLLTERMEITKARYWPSNTQFRSIWTAQSVELSVSTL